MAATTLQCLCGEDRWVRHIDDELREAAEIFGDTDAPDEWEARRRELAVFYAVHKRLPRRRALQSSERHLAVWAERQVRRRCRGSGGQANEVLLQMTPGWNQAASWSSPS